MTLDLDNLLTAVFREVRPREGFAAELLTMLTQEGRPLLAIDDPVGRPRFRWVLAGAVAGVVTATGAVYVAARRHQGGAA